MFFYGYFCRDFNLNVMRIKGLSVENYRNLSTATIAFEESCNFIVGENNLGKSNILNLLNIIDRKSVV